MPAAPEVLDRDGRVRGVEVLREPEPEQERDPDRDVRVAEEVGVDLHRVRVDADEHLERRVLVGGAEDLVDDVRGQVVRDHDLHEQARADEEERAGRVDVARVARRLELRDELARAHDRPGDEMREEREVGGELRKRRRLEVAPVDVDDVADRHEREERDADRKHDRARFERDVDADEREQVVRRGREEVVVLEVAEQRHVAGDRDREERFRACASFRWWIASAKSWFQTIDAASRKTKRQSQAL